jgi:hypothetical protein
VKPFDEYERFFAFGCSVTNYIWPTWADIIATEIPNYFNFARSGSGNLLIANSVVEANVTWKFTEKDLVMVMWSSPQREDRYKNGRWLSTGNIYNQDLMDESFVTEWADERFYLIRDLALIESTRGYLDNLPCDFEMLSMVDFADDSNPDIINLYSDTINSIKQSIKEVSYSGTWPETFFKEKGKGVNGGQLDYHPRPLGHLKYLESFCNTTTAMTRYAQTHERNLLGCTYLEDITKHWVPEGYNVERL